MATDRDDRLPPNNLEAEQATLGAMIVDPDAVTRGLAIVGADDFYREAHQCICRAIATIHGRGDPVDMVTVGDELRRREQLDHCGGAEYLSALIGQVPTTKHIVPYADIIVKKAHSRAIMDLGASMEAKACGDPDDPSQLLSEFRRACPQSSSP